MKKAYTKYTQIPQTLDYQKPPFSELTQPSTKTLQYNSALTAKIEKMGTSTSNTQPRQPALQNYTKMSYMASRRTKRNPPSE